MDAAAAGALLGLSAAVSSLLPPAPDPAFAPTLSLGAVDLRPTGLGGFVAYAHDPEGEIVGRRVEADAVVTARAGNLQDLQASVDDIVGAVLATDRSTLRAQGLLRITLAELGPTTAPPAEGGDVARDLRFRVLYEFLHLPTEAAGVIERIPVDLEVGRGRARTLFDTGTDGFGEDALSLFEVVDDAAATTGAPSDWAVNVDEARIEQRARIRGGGTTATPNKPGTYLVLRTTPSLPPVRDFSLRAAVATGDVGGVGLVFRYQDAQNFYFFLMDNRRGFRMLGKKVGGVFQAWERPGLDETRSFEVNRIAQLRVSMDGPVAQVFLDGEQVLEGRDGALASAGRVGFMSRDVAGAFLYGINLSEW